MDKILSVSGQKSFRTKKDLKGIYLLGKSVVVTISELIKIGYKLLHSVHDLLCLCTVDHKRNNQTTAFENNTDSDTDCFNS